MSPMALVSAFTAKIARELRALRPANWRSTAPHPVLAEALGRWSAAPSDIHDHLGAMFVEAVSARPRLIVELGTRGGISTRALLAAAEVADAHLLSIDLEDCETIDFPERFRSRWSFVRADDVDFAGEPFSAFCGRRGLPPLADVVLVDTSHRYDHTRAEIGAWLPRLAPRGVMMFHDTNMGSGWFRRLDGVVAAGWDNQRGVIRAIEELLGRTYDERSYFTDIVGGYAVRHAPWSSGFTVLSKIGDPRKA